MECKREKSCKCNGRFDKRVVMKSQDQRANNVCRPISFGLKPGGTFLRPGHWWNILKSSGDHAYDSYVVGMKLNVISLSQKMIVIDNVSNLSCWIKKIVFENFVQKDIAN